MRLRVEIPEPVSLPYRGQEMLFEAPKGYFEMDVYKDMTSSLVSDTRQPPTRFTMEQTLSFLGTLLERGITIRAVSLVMSLVFVIAATLAASNMAYAAEPSNMAHVRDDGSGMAAVGCTADAFRQEDMAGAYISDYMRVDIGPCGVSAVTWINEYGQHRSYYHGSLRMEGGGIVATLAPDQPYGLDGRRAIGYKPAERGFLQVFTTDAYGTDVRVYRLMKVDGITY